MIVSFKGKVENLEDDWKDIAQGIGIRGLDMVPLIRENSPVDKPSYKDEYDEDSKKLIGEMFKFDIEFMEYEF